MFDALKRSGRLELTLLLGGMSLFCFALTVFRFQHTHSRMFLFLNWNLFLALVPWLATSAMILKPGMRRSRLALAGVMAIWILFFPNSPYILTDLFHLHHRPGVPIWFDLVLILSFAWTGLAFGFISLLDIEKLFLERLSRPWAAASLAFLLFLGSFGVYLGRFLRWNSWDVLQAPLGLLADIADRLANPLAHSRTWGMTLIMGILLNMIFWTLKLIKRHYAGSPALPTPLEAPRG